MKFCKQIFPVPMALLCLSFSFITRAQEASAGVPVFKISTDASRVTFAVKASVPIEGHFDKWNATLTFTSTDLSTGVLDIKIDAASVNTGSSIKNNKLKSEDFFDTKSNPYITFHSTKGGVQTGPNTVEVPGTFTIRGVSRPETLIIAIGKQTATHETGEIKGIGVFDRKEYGMNSGVPFIKIADRVEVSVDLKGERVSGPPIAVKR